ncbi:MAG: hypothetical protein KGY46_05310 [Anaerolineales bacterium]|nr:hypothetical protein [Anaerolineales bacterium]
MTTYYLGIDVGASNSQVMIADQSGQLQAFTQGDGANPDWVGNEGMGEVLRGLLEKALNEADIDRNQVAGAGFGIAGYDWPSQKSGLIEAIDILDLSAPFDLVNDAMLALLAGASNDWGIGVVAGTSCNAWGRDKQHRLGRMTGYSWLGEASGGVELVDQAQRAVAKEWTRRGPPTSLTQLFQERVGASSVDDLIEGIARRQYKLQPDDAKLVFQAARDGDLVAHELVLWAGRELGDLALGVVRQLNLANEQVEIILAGSFWKGSPLLLSAFESVVYPIVPEASIERLKAPPVVGGVCLGMELAGMKVDRIKAARERLRKEAQKDP